MTTGTKIFLAVFAGFIGVLVLYYGVLMHGSAAPPTMGAPGGPIFEKSTETPTAAAEPTLVENPAVAPAESDHAQAPSVGAIGPDDAAPSAHDPLSNWNSVLPLAQLGSHADHDGAPARSTSDPSAPTSEIARGSSRVHANEPVILPDSGHTATMDPRRMTPPTTFEYVVKSGDTGSSIAGEWFGDRNKWGLISKANPLVDFNRLQIGQKLRLPPKDAQSETVKEVVTERGTTTDKTIYIVRPGDTLAKIARERFGDVLKWKAIYDANKSVIGNDPAALQVGMKLKLPSNEKPLAEKARSS